MTETKRVSRKDLTAAEILDVIEDGGRVVIELSVLGRSTDVVIRERDGTYYCDTAMKLLVHESREELRECLERFQLARREPVDEIERGGIST
ncbi:hypothetical protein [Natrarchaeobius oligotrophus]|uniref:DUF8001 domain-containing protein n=1 Tax=Natrarchaeobius chitinivorans TaxID=1679083 RepID=A0A3N6MZQ0_NATCH|nr:hypothetical protein [Natrarchaeobius chitinivorans]RQH02012.1 hypothetical protein EA472_06875 [Natrarchaeobius chitinivorans]